MRSRVSVNHRRCCDRSFALFDATRLASRNAAERLPDASLERGRAWNNDNEFDSGYINAASIFLGFDTLTLGIHHLNHRILDIYFKNYTIWAEWPAIVIGVLGLSIKNWRMGLWFSLIFGLEALSIQAIKVFLNFPRPIEKFGLAIRHVDGEVLKHFQAFPSGHTSAAFFATGMILLSLPENSKKHLFLNHFSDCILAT